MPERPPVDADANEASLRHLANRLLDPEIQWAVAVGNLAAKHKAVVARDALIKEIRELIGTIDFDFVDDALRRRKDERAAGQRAALAELRAAFTDTADE